jgi:hypothetical protein
MAAGTMSRAAGERSAADAGSNKFFPGDAHHAAEVVDWHMLAQRSAAVSLGLRWSFTCIPTRRDFLVSCTPSGLAVLVAGRGGSRSVTGIN